MKFCAHEVFCTIFSFTQEFTEHEELLEVVALLREKTFHYKFIVFFNLIEQGNVFPSCSRPSALSKFSVCYKS